MVKVDDKKKIAFALTMFVYASKTKEFGREKISQKQNCIALCPSERNTFKKRGSLKNHKV